MSYSGYSVFQAAQISDSTARIDAAELAITQNLSTAVAKYSLLDAKDVEHDQFLSTLSGVKVDVSVFEAAVADSMAKNDEQDDRLTAVEGRATALESDIATRVEAEIQSKVSQVIFDSIHADLMATDSALASTLATKVAATVQTQLDEGQNSTIATKVAIADYDVYVSSATAAIASKVAQTDYNMYVSTNNALVATKYATADFNTFSTIVSNRIGARVTLSQYETDVAAFVDRMDGMDADIAARVTLSQYTAEQSSQNAAIATKLSSAQYITERDIQDAHIATKLATADYQFGKNVQDAVIASKVAQTDYDQYVTLNNAAVASKLATVDYEIHEAAQNAQIALKVAQSEYDGFVGATNAALASKVSIADYNADQNAQNVQIASKVAQVVYDEEMSAVDALAQHFEKRFIALEEFARALLATYTITKPDSTLYNYTGSPQNMVIPPPVFSVVGKKSVSGSSVLVLEFTEYGYNTFLGDVAVWTNQGPLTFVKADVDAQTRRRDVALPQGYTLPLNIEFRDRAESPIYTFQVTQVVFDGLTDLSAGGSSSTPITILGVSYDGLYPHILIAPHGDLDVMGFLFRNGEFVSFGGNVFGAATTTVTKIPIPGSTNLNNLSGTWSYGSTVNWADPANGGIKDDIAGVYTAPDTPRPTTGSDWTDLTNNTDIAVNNSVYSFTTGSSGSVKVFVRTDTQPGGEMFVGLWREGTVANLLNVSSTVTDRNYADMYFNGTSNVISVMQNAFNTTSTPNFVLNLLPNTKYYINTFTYWNQPKELNQADDISVRMIDALSEANLAVTYEQGVTDYDTYALVPKNFNLTISGDTVFVESREVFNGIISLYYVPAGVNDWDYAYLTNKVFANESGVKSIYVGASGLGAGAKLFIMNSNNAKISNTLIVPPPAPTYPLTIYHDADTNQIRAQATPSGVVRFNSKHPGIGGTVFDFGYSTSTTTDVNIAGYIIGSQNPAWENLYLVDLDGNQISNQLIYGVSV